MSFSQRPLQGRDDGFDFSKYFDQAYERRANVVSKIPNWVQTGIKLYYGRDDEAFSTFLADMTDIVKYDIFQGDHYFDLFLETASCLKEGKTDEVPLDDLQNLDFTGMFYVHFYFRHIDREVPEFIDNLFQEKRAEAEAEREKPTVKEIQF